MSSTEPAVNSMSYIIRLSLLVGCHAEAAAPHWASTVELSVLPGLCCLHSCYCC